MVSSCKIIPLILYFTNNNNSRNVTIQNFFYQKPRKPIIFTANAHKNTQGHCQPNKDSICYNLSLHTHDEDHFRHPQILKLASGTHSELILNRDKKHNEIYQKVTKKLLQRQNINNQINSLSCQPQI